MSIRPESFELALSARVYGLYSGAHVFSLRERVASPLTGARTLITLTSGCGLRLLRRTSRSRLPEAVCALLARYCALLAVSIARSCLGNLPNPVHVLFPSLDMLSGFMQNPRPFLGMLGGSALRVSGYALDGYANLYDPAQAIWLRIPGGDLPCFSLSFTVLSGPASMSRFVRLSRTPCHSGSASCVSTTVATRASTRFMVMASMLCLVVC
jgi:hypothetical protein